VAANHVIEASTWESYTYSIYAHIMDDVGSMRMIDILPSHVRDSVTTLGTPKAEPEHDPAEQSDPQRHLHAALNDQVTVLHPCKGVKTPPVPKHRLHGASVRGVAVRRGCG
jgi:hypothetical protein